MAQRKLTISVAARLMARRNNLPHEIKQITNFKKLISIIDLYNNLSSFRIIYSF